RQEWEHSLGVVPVGTGVGGLWYSPRRARRRWGGGKTCPPGEGGRGRGEGALTPARVLPFPLPSSPAVHTPKAAYRLGTGETPAAAAVPRRSIPCISPRRRARARPRYARGLGAQAR